MDLFGGMDMIYITLSKCCIHVLVASPLRESWLSLEGEYILVLVLDEHKPVVR